MNVKDLYFYISDLMQRRKIPLARNRNEVKPITWRQFDWLMSGLETEQPKAIKKYRKCLIFQDFSLVLWYN